MAKTPDHIKVKAELDTPAVKQAMEDAHRTGYSEGLEKGRVELLDWLEWAYIKDEGRPDRGSTEAKAILEIARAASNHLQKLRKSKA